jgi:hypothetical protein
VWSDGRIVGSWKQEPDGTIATWFLEPVSRRVTTAVRQEAKALESWLGDRRWVSVFPQR